MNTYERVTDQIVRAIESHPGQWRMPWHTLGHQAVSPINVISRKPYRGVNTLSLWAEAQSKDYTRGEWGTYQQWSEIGAQVRKGEKASLVVFWKFDEVERKTADGDTEKRDSVFCRGYSVFNASQVDGYRLPSADIPEEPERIARAEEFFRTIPASVRHEGNRAYYSPGTDGITLPPFRQFFSPLDYYSTRAHESAHWTAPRLERQLGKRFGDSAYAMEELVAELSAAFTLARLQLSATPREDHAQYIATWLKVLRSDTRAIFTAASQAQKATDYLSGFSVQAEKAAA